MDENSGSSSSKITLTPSTDIFYANIGNLVGTYKRRNNDIVRETRSCTSSPSPLLYTEYELVDCVPKNKWPLAAECDFDSPLSSSSSSNNSNKDYTGDLTESQDFNFEVSSAGCEENSSSACDVDLFLNSDLEDNNNSVVDDLISSSSIDSTIVYHTVSSMDPIDEQISQSELVVEEVKILSPFTTYTLLDSESKQEEEEEEQCCTLEIKSAPVSSTTIKLVEEEQFNKNNLVIELETEEEEEQQQQQEQNEEKEEEKQEIEPKKRGRKKKVAPVPTAAPTGKRGRPPGRKK